MPDNNYITAEALNRVEQRLSEDIDVIQAHVKQNSEAIIELKALYQSLVKLPDTIASLEKTVIKVNLNLDRLNERIEDINSGLVEQRERLNDLKQENAEQNANIEEIDNKSKIDWITAVTENFWKIILVVGVVYMMFKDML